MAHPGDLDTSFGSGGKKTINFGGTDPERGSCSCSPTGGSSPPGAAAPRAPSASCACAPPTGRSTPPSASGGKRIVDFGTDDESVYGAALQPDGKIVLAGDSRLQVAVVRLKSNGALDTTFDGDGQQADQLGRDRPRHGHGRRAQRQAPDRRLLGPEGGNIQVARQKPNGALDPTFAAGGIAAIDFGGDDFGEALARQADGRDREWPDGRRPRAPWSHGCERRARSTRTSAAAAA